MSKDEDSDKSHEPSQRKLDEARKKGEIVRSTDIVAASAYAGFLLAMMANGAQGVQDFGSVMMAMIAQSRALSAEIFSGGAIIVTASVMLEIVRSIWLWFVFPVAAVLVSVFAQRAFVFAPTKLNPRLSRISLIDNMKNKFGPSGLFEFLKSSLKLTIFTILLCAFLYSKFPQVAESVYNSPSVFMGLLGRLALEFILIVVVVMAVFGGVDYFWQRHRHMIKNRMSHKELRDEHKEAEGDPHLKQERRSRAQQVASRQMVAEVKAADVVIVNPTHYSVALKWSRQPGEAPTCVAKGTDEVALQIREIARENGVPVHADPPTARLLFARLKVGDSILEEHFKAVAIAIRFAEGIRKKARKMG